MLKADQLQQDPRVLAAKETLLEAVREHSASITGPKAPDPNLAHKFEAQAEESTAVRGRGLALPYLASGLGNGAWVELTDGSVKLDFISGIGVHILGHSHPLIVESGIDAALTDTVMQGNLQMGYDSIELGRLLLDLANQEGADLGHCFLSTSGAMANENALKVAFQAKAPATRVLAFEGAFAGRSMATAQITARAAYRKGLPSTLSVDRVPYFDHRDPEASTRAALQAIDGHLSKFPGEHALMVVEPILGEGGFYPGNSAYF
ncbi:MAG: aminotransferase class III-fold pyridoxal phosphate-dependent enzyme, partial [Verrucomicrobiota bacterium]